MDGLRNGICGVAQYAMKGEMTVETSHGRKPRTDPARAGSGPPGSRLAGTAHATSEPPKRTCPVPADRAVSEKDIDRLLHKVTNSGGSMNGDDAETFLDLVDLARRLLAERAVKDRDLADAQAQIEHEGLRNRLNMLQLEDQLAEARRLHDEHCIYQKFKGSERSCHPLWEKP